jgi:hypothetical protein
MTSLIVIGIAFSVAMLCGAWVLAHGAMKEGEDE